VERERGLLRRETPRELGNLRAGIRRKIVCKNAATLYGFAPA
jgi:hypothetical protein